MGQACGSARDSQTPNENRLDKRNRDKRLTSLEDIINVKKRRSLDVRFSYLQKKKLYERKFSVKKQDIAKIQNMQQMMKNNKVCMKSQDFLLKTDFLYTINQPKPFK